ncbi:MAG: discoidin domain-containing protein [Verrucomicrobiia bacterium]
MKSMLASLVVTLMWLLSAMPASAGLPVFQQTGNRLVMSNRNVRVEYNLDSGTADFFWQNAKIISAFYGVVTNSGSYIASTGYTKRAWATVSSNRVVVTNTGGGFPTMKQYFTLDRDNSFLASVEMDGPGLSANWMAPVVMNTPGGMDVGSYNDDRALFVPFDNDSYIRYDAMPINSAGNGYEVGAFYDNTPRNGLVVGSVTHDTWKTGVAWSGSNNKLDQLIVYGGARSPYDIYSGIPHGSVSGNAIFSPIVFVGFGTDWRTMLENFADENTNFVARLVWTNGVPFGWNSWGCYRSAINYDDAIAVSDSIHTNLQPYGFNNGGTVYVNLDSFWDNFSSTQLTHFANRCHTNGQKAGIYWGPFVYWGTLSQSSNQIVPGTGNTYYYSDILLRNASGGAIQENGGQSAYAIDPSHPGTKQLINYQMNLFAGCGFNYIKIDFLSHGALEGVHHDPAVTTGIQAYNVGMQTLMTALNGRMFISESIAPLFPYQYGHSRRIACDAQSSRIGNTEYTMNSVSYGWWLDRLYSFNDPDIMDFGTGANINENQSRVISGAVTGIFLDGDDLTDSASISAAQTSLTNAAINAVARAGQTFRPVEGDTGSHAEDMFVRQDGTNWCVAVFNYKSIAVNKTVDLARAGLPPGTYVAVNLWDGTSSVVAGTLNVSLNAKQSKLFRLTAGHYALPAPASENSGKPAAAERTPSSSAATATVSASNIAPGKPASASSEESGKPAQNGNDGNRATRWCASSGDVPQWWQVDLGGTVTITSTKILWEHNALYQYRIEVSSNQTNWTVVVDKTTNSIPSQTSSDDFSAKGRYVRVLITGLEEGSWASFYEFQVFGSGGKPPAAERLKQVKSLYDQGLINKEDYNKKVKEILDSL